MKKTIKTCTLVALIFVIAGCKHSIANQESKASSANQQGTFIQQDLNYFSQDDWDFMLKLSQISKAAYKKPTEISNYFNLQNPLLSNIPFKFLIKNETQAYFFETQENIIISFRGTEKNATDIATDIKILPSFTQTDESRHVHPGFYKAYEKIRSQIIQNLQENANNSTYYKPLIVTGHSLGGSLSQICALDLHKLGYPISNVITFGAPPPFRKNKIKEYSSLLGAITFRFIHNLDVIPGLLTKVLPYKQVGHAIYFQGQACEPTENGNYRIGKANFKDHKLESYMRCLNIQTQN